MNPRPKTLPNSETKSPLAEPNAFSILPPPQPQSVDINPDNPTISEFVKAIQAGITCWEMAGQILVELHRSDPGVFKKIMAQSAWITSDTLWAFHRIGLGKLYPQVLLLRKCPAESELLSADYETQKKLCNQATEVCIKLNGDKPVVEKRWVSEIGKETAALVFNNGKVRSAQEQADLLRKRQREAKELEAKKTMPIRPEPEAPKAFSNTIAHALPKKLSSIGWFKLSWIKGHPILDKGEGAAPQRAQSVTCLALTAEDTVIDFKAWVEK